MTASSLSTSPSSLLFAVPDHPDMSRLVMTPSTRSKPREYIEQLWRLSWMFNFQLGSQIGVQDIHSAAAIMQSGAPEVGDEILRGVFKFANVKIATEGAAPWFLEAPKDWHILLHSFSWLHDLASSSHRDKARQLARDLILSWCRQFSSWSPVVWSPATMGTRLYQILQHHDDFLSASNTETRRQINGSLLRQARCLVKDIERPLPAMTRVIALRGLTASACAFSRHRKLRRTARKAIVNLLPETLTSDGVVLDRCPESQVCLINHLIEIRRLARSREWPEWEVPHSLLGIATPALKYILQNDGGLPLMQGATLSNRRVIHRLINHSEWQSLWADRIDSWDMQRISLEAITALLDTGAFPAKENAALAARAPLALEVSIGVHRVITGCGVNRAIGHKEDTLRSALRSSAAHSTLSIGDSDADFGLDTWHVESRDVRTTSVSQTALGSWTGVMNGTKVAHQREITIERELVAGTVGLRGIDTLTIPKACPYALRFHLHPDVRVNEGPDEETIQLTLPNGSKWSFKGRGRLWVDDSIYRPDGYTSQPTRQLVMYGKSCGGLLQIGWSLESM